MSFYDRVVKVSGFVVVLMLPIVFFLTAPHSLMSLTHRADLFVLGELLLISVLCASRGLPRRLKYAAIIAMSISAVVVRLATNADMLRAFCVLMAVTHTFFAYWLCIHMVSMYRRAKDSDEEQAERIVEPIGMRAKVLVAGVPLAVGLWLLSFPLLDQKVLPMPALKNVYGILNVESMFSLYVAAYCAPSHSVYLLDMEKNELVECDLGEGTVLNRHAFPNAEPMALKASPDGRGVLVQCVEYRENISIENDERIPEGLLAVELPDYSLWYVEAGSPEAKVAVQDFNGSLAFGNPFSPDGSRVALSGLRYLNISDFSVDYFDVSEGINAEDFSGFCAWSPDASQIAYTRFHRDSGARGRLGAELCIVDLPNKELHTPTVDGEMLDVSSVAWDPDGQRLACVSADGLIRVIKVGNSDEVLLTAKGKQYGTVVWSGTSKIVFDQLYHATAVDVLSGKERIVGDRLDPGYAFLPAGGSDQITWCSGAYGGSVYIERL